MSLQRTLLDHLPVCVLKATLFVPGLKHPLVPLRSYFVFKILPWTDQVWLLWLDGDPVYLWGGRRTDELKKHARISSSWLVLSPTSSLLPPLCSLFCSLRSLSLSLLLSGRAKKRKNSCFWICVISIKRRPRSPWLGQWTFCELIHNLQT